jgi:hypothetical protein
MADIDRGENPMKALNGMSVAISSLAFAGAAALTAGAAIPANAEVAVSASRAMNAGNAGEAGDAGDAAQGSTAEQSATHGNGCGNGQMSLDVSCGSAALQGIGGGSMIIKMA